MAVTLAAVTHGTYKVKNDERKIRTEKHRTVTFDSSYPTGGEAVSAADVGLSRITSADARFLGGFSAAFSFVEPLVQSTGSVLLRLRAAAGTEVPNATDASTVSVRLIVWGY